jgi:hypothetical protein
VKLTRRSIVGAVLSALVAALALANVSAAQAVVAGSISGSVTVPAGYDVRAVRVIATTAGLHPSPGAPAASTMTAPDGTFTLTNLPAGSYNVGFATYWSDMNPCSVNRDRWWTSPGVASGTCNYSDPNGTLTGAGAVTVSDGATTDLGSTPLLTEFPVRTYSGRLVAPPGHTAAGLQAELWIADEGAWYLPGGYYRLTSVPVQTLTASGEFSLSTINPPWSQYAIRFVDQPANGYTCSFANGGLTADTTGSGGADFGAGSIGLLKVPSSPGENDDLGTHQLAFELGYSSGGVTVTGSPEWGRTLTAQSTVVWSDPSVGTGFQWYRNGVAIDGATGPSYVLNTMDDGWEAAISARAVPLGAWAYNDSPIESPPLTVENTTPYNVAAPKVGGTAQVGRVLTASTGSWRPTAANFSYSYRWFRGTSPVPGATAATYAVAPLDLGSRLSVEVTASRPPDCPLCSPWFTGPGMARSGAAPAVKAGVIASSWITKWPTKATKARVGQRSRLSPLRLSAAGRTQQLRATYQWYVGGKRVKGATSATFKIKKGYRHRPVLVRVTISKAGYTPRTKAVAFGKAR